MDESSNPLINYIRSIHQLPASEVSEFYASFREEHARRGFFYNPGPAVMEVLTPDGKWWVYQDNKWVEKES